MKEREKALALFQRLRKYEIQKNGRVQCPYCRKWIDVKNAVAVHYIARGHRSLEVERKNVWAGCASCNYQDMIESGQGEYHDMYRDWLLNNPDVGEWGVLWLENRKNIIVKHGKVFYLNLIEECKKELKKYEQK